MSPLEWCLTIAVLALIGLVLYLLTSSGSGGGVAMHACRVAADLGINDDACKRYTLVSLVSGKSIIIIAPIKDAAIVKVGDVILGPYA